MNGRAKSSSGVPRATPGAAGNRPGDGNLSRLADAFALATAAIGVLVLAGWLLGIEPLKRVLPGLVAMKFNTALAFVAGGAALWWRQRPALRLALGALVAVFGALALGEYFSGGAWGIDQLFFRDVPAAPAAAFPPGRMSPATAVCFLLCGAALMCSRRSKSGPHPGPAPAVEAAPGYGFVVDVLAFGAAAVAGFVLIGYATGTESLHHLPGYISMALNTAAAFVFLAAGILCAAREGVIAQAVRSRGTGRTLWLGFGLITILLVTLGLASAVRLRSIGEALAARDSGQAAVLRDLQNTEVLILALLVVGVLIAMVISKLVGRAVLGHGEALRAADETARQRLAEIENLYRNAPVGLCVLDRDLRFLRINERLAEINGIPAADHIGKTVRELLPGLADAVEPGMRRVLETGEPRLNIEIVSEMPDSKGAQRSWLEQWLPIKDSEGRVTGLNIVVEEITDRKQAEEKLAWLASFPGLNPNPIAEIDLAGGEVKYANPTAERLFPDLARLGIAHPLLAGALEQANAVRTKGEPVVREVAVGDTWYLETLSLTPDRQRLRVYGLDITERKSAEEALGESEARYRLIFETANEGIWVTDGERRTVLVNQRMADMLGYSVDELLGRFPAEFLCAGQEPVALKTRQELSAGETTHYEFKFRRKDGSDLWVISSASPVRDREGRLISTISMLTDITERQKTEALRQALAEQDRARLGAAVEQASDSVVIFDLDGKIRYVNAAFESINQLPRERAVGHSYLDLLAGDPSAAALRTAIGQGLAWHGPISRAIPDGRTIELEVMYSPARDPAGTIIGGLVTARDVTRVNALQEQVRQAQKMEALGTLAGGITHDFNNILGTIVINTELALLDLDPSDPARRPLPVVLQAANRGKELVKQIITFSRQRAWERKPVDIAPVVREGLGLLRSTLPKDILLRETIGDASGVVLADPSHIHQILVNLCQNAALAMRDGGERQLDVELGPVEVDAAMAIRNPDLEPGPYVRLTVADTGCGMTPETMERIFEPFFTTRERGSGSGLGLSVVHGIVKSYGGAIAVRSRSGQGSVFNIYLPRLGEDVQAAGTEPAPQPARGQARILVVEDEEAQRTSLARGLERLGYGVAAEPDGRSALAAFRKDPGAFDLVITDQIMPRMSGLELAAELTKVRPGVPVILCTGFSENVNDGTVGTSGIRELAMKPFTVTEISQLVRKVLEKEKVRP